MLSHIVTAQVAVAGAVVGCLGAVGIYWAPDEPYKHWIVGAGRQESPTGRKSDGPPLM